MDMLPEWAKGFALGLAAMAVMAGWGWGIVRQQDAARGRLAKELREADRDAEAKRSAGDAELHARLDVLAASAVQKADLARETGRIEASLARLDDQIERNNASVQTRLDRLMALVGRGRVALDAEDPR
ncbi:MAG: hypothetical protein AB7H93_23660 [Vicinamibacterales bacterium]